METTKQPLIGREETVGDILMDIQVSVGLMSEHSQARRVLLRCATALAYLGKMAEAWKARAEAAEAALAAALEPEAEATAEEHEPA